MGIYHKIMVTLDCSPVDIAIVDHVVLLAKSENSTVVLTHVVHSHTLDQNRILLEKAKKGIEKYKKIFLAAGIPVEICLLSGEPEKELEKEIKANHYDLVAMATHGHKALSDILYGSVSGYLKHHISIPILLIHGARENDE
ncbi:universal stress protein [Sphaerochaeta sp.]|jgi:universal stress protein A|uniref:universal stress protein n=1 Tax=Sphaerochaeta sp. TaxID=1972642 RepID=UPI002FC658F2